MDELIELIEALKEEKSRYKTSILTLKKRVKEHPFALKQKLELEELESELEDTEKFLLALDIEVLEEVEEEFSKEKAPTLSDKV